MKKLVMKSCEVFFDDDWHPTHVRVSSDDYMGILKIAKGSA